MLKIENTEVYGWEAAIRGMRNPMNSWGQSDSNFSCEDCTDCYYCPNVVEGARTVTSWCNHTGLEIGPIDLDLMRRLRKAGTDHRKFMRMITVSCDLVAPLYWWKEYDTYKVGTVANSCSTMHKIHAKEFTMEDFSHEHLIHEWVDEEIVCFDGEYGYSGKEILQDVIIPTLNHFRQKFIETKTKPMKEESKRSVLMKRYWWQMIQLLPTSYNQRRTVMLNYEVLSNIYKSRKNHKLDEWHTFCEWIEGLPYSELITGVE